MGLTEGDPEPQSSHKLKFLQYSKDKNEEDSLCHHPKPLQGEKFRNFRDEILGIIFSTKIGLPVEFGTELVGKIWYNKYLLKWEQ